MAEPVEREECGFCDGDPECTCPCHKPAAPTSVEPRCKHCKKSLKDCLEHAGHPFESDAQVFEVKKPQVDTELKFQPLENSPAAQPAKGADDDRRDFLASLKDVSPAVLKAIAVFHRKRAMIAEERIGRAEEALKEARKIFERELRWTAVRMIDAALAASSGVKHD